MNTIEELITELLFADDCTLLAHTEEALQNIVNHFSDAAKNFGLTISLKKTEALYQPTLRVANSPLDISIDGTNLNAVEHFTYLGSIISNDATVSKDLDNRLSKASSSFERLSKRVWQSHSLHTKIQIQGHHRSHPPVWCRDLGSLLEADQATGMVSPKLLALHPPHQMARPHATRRSPQESQPAQHRVPLASGTAALGWPRHKDGRHMHAQSSLLQQAPRRKAQSWCSKKAFQRSAEETVCKGGNQPSVMAAEGVKPSQLALSSEKSQLQVQGREA